MPLMTLLHRVMHARTSAYPSAIARMLIGCNAMLAGFETWRMLPRVLAPLVVRLPFLSWIPVLPASAIREFLALWFLAALFFILGWKTRIAGSVLSFLTGYTLILDEQTYSNHLYLLFLVLLLLTIAESGAVWSVDARHREAKRDIAAWPIVLLKIQISIAYFFSALAKLTPEYLAGEILMRSLKRGGLFAVPLAWRTPTFVSTLAIASIATELFIAVGLWSRRLRPFAIAAGIGFHFLILTIVDSSRLSLAIFAFAMFAVYLLFASKNENPADVQLQVETPAGS